MYLLCPFLPFVFSRNFKKLAILILPGSTNFEVSNLNKFSTHLSYFFHLLKHTGPLAKNILLVFSFGASSNRFDKFLLFLYYFFPTKVTFKEGFCYETLRSKVF